MREHALNATKKKLDYIRNRSPRRRFFDSAVVSTLVQNPYDNIGDIDKTTNYSFTTPVNLENLQHYWHTTIWANSSPRQQENCQRREDMQIKFHQSSEHCCKTRAAADADHPYVGSTLWVRSTPTMHVVVQDSNEQLLLRIAISGKIARSHAQAETWDDLVIIVIHVFIIFYRNFSFSFILFKFDLLWFRK